MQDSQPGNHQPLNPTNEYKGSLEEKLQAQLDAKESNRESARPERMRLLASKEQLGLPDWIEITGIGIDDESHYTISEKSVCFNGWSEETIRSAPSKQQPDLIRQNEELCLAFSCTPKEMLDFIDNGAGRLFGSFFVPDEFRTTVVQIEQATAHAAAVDSMGAPLSFEIEQAPSAVRAEAQISGSNENSDNAVKQKKTISHRANENRAFLTACIASGIAPKIDSIWLHIRENVGKGNFMFKTASKSSATTVDGKQVQKKNLARALRNLPVVSRNGQETS
jgi:hypothetical protein